MGRTNEDVVMEYLAATEDLDLDRVAELIADDIAVHIPGDNPISGDYRGRKDVLAYMESVFERSRAAGAGIEVAVHDMLSSDDHVVLLSRRDFAGIDARGIVIYHVEDGRITEAWVHEVDQAAVDRALHAAFGD